MPLSDGERWILPENLRKQEIEAVAAVERGEDASGGDFGSYHALLTGKHPEWVQKHAVTDPRYLAAYARQVAELAGRGAESRPSILDVGCGHGPVTRALFDAMGGGNTLGIDLSRSAILYAKTQNSGCRFEVVAVDAETDLKETFDIVHAREFYPFTRTGAADFHKLYLEVLARHLAPRGTLVLSLADKPGSLWRAHDAVAPVLRRLGLEPFLVWRMAHPRIPGWIPAPIARAATSFGIRCAGTVGLHFYVAARS